MNCAVSPENAPPLVLCHGVTRCWREWRPLLPALTERWLVVRFSELRDPNIIRFQAP